MIKRFPQVFLALLLLCNVSAHAQFKVMGAYDTTCCALPYYLTVPDTLSPCFLSRINASLPEGLSVPCYEPQYLAATAPTTLHLLADADSVWLTFAWQGDWYENALGYYTFPWGHPPTTIADSMVTIVFPNASLWGYGGALHLGARVNLGPMAANTGIGFVLVGNGWQASPTVTWRTDSFLAQGKSIFYSDPMLNPAAESDTFRHVVALYDQPSSMILCGFEDRNRGGVWQPDDDFNDVVFYLNTNNGPIFDTAGYPHTTVSCDSSGVSSGGTGGLESESLGGIIGKRDFERIKNGTFGKNGKPAKKVPYKPEATLNGDRVTGSSPVLERFVPASLYIPTYDPTKPSSSDSVSATPYYSTPTDITSVTFAKDVLSVDYEANNQVKAVVLGITTLGRAYNHTKSICDRFRGATLLSADTISIQGYKFILFAMQQADGNVEYSITFDVGKSMNGSTFYLQSKWLISQYKGFDSVFNFQVWTSNPGNTVKLTNQLLNTIQSIYPVQQVDSNFVLPTAYIANGKRNQGQLNITVTNNSSATFGQIMLEENKTETAPLDTLSYNIALTGGTANSFAYYINDGYQYEGHLYVNGVLTDDVYMADGNWSLDYDTTTSNLTSCVFGNEYGRVYDDSDFPLYRSAAIQGVSLGVINVYKYLASGDEPVDLSAYNSFKFYGKGSGQVTIRMIKASVANFADQYYNTYTMNASGTNSAISLNDFQSDKYTAAFDPSDVVAVVYSMNFYGLPTSVDFYVGSGAFSHDQVPSLRNILDRNIYVYPNPNEGSFECLFYADQVRTMNIVVSDVTGRVVYTMPVSASIGRNTVQVTLPQDVPRPSLMMVKLGNSDVKYNVVKVNYIK
jgi:Domain of unknown function (DUF4114)